MGGINLKLNARAIILALVVLAVGVIFVVPYLSFGSEGEFVVTAQPATALREAKEAGKPVFLEFYSPA